MVKQHVILICLICWVCSCTVNKNEIGRPYTGWKKGEMDIHHIYTGRGEANFHIFPDGTTMLIDAGDYDPKDYNKMCKMLPNSTRRSGEWIARYIKQVNPYKDYVDYLVISHFHSDHIGDCTNDAILTSGRNPEYVLTGIAEVGESIQFGKLIDRGWPNYQYPLPIKDPHFDNYHAFVKWNIKNNGLIVEKFEVGSNKQISLLKDKVKFKNNFLIQNLAANGKIWTGVDNNTINYYDLHPDNLENWQNENTKSIAMRVSYGSFSYFTGGDISGHLKSNCDNVIDIEEEVAKVCGPVHVCKANHHAYKDAMSEGFLKRIKAMFYIIPVWDYEHIQPKILERIVSLYTHENEKIIFPTNFPKELRELYYGEEWIKSISNEDGHVVIKVLNGGHKFKIYVLSAKNENQIVKQVHGPYETKLRVQKN